MWEWLFGRRRSPSPREHHPPDAAQTTGSSPGVAVPTTMGALADEMKANGFQGPFAHMGDGVIAVVFHGPGVSLEPSWIEPTGNPFQMRILDCREFALRSPIYPIDEGGRAVEASFSQ